MSKLNEGEHHLLRLIDRDKGEDGWTVVSVVLYQMVFNVIHEKLAEFTRDGERCRARLTKEGETVLKWL